MKKGSEEHKAYKQARGDMLNTKKVQAREPWNVRAIKLQLLRPDLFERCLTLKQSDHMHREFTGGYFSSMNAAGILKSIDFGMLTPYRITLLLRACRSYDRQCKKERSRVQHQTQGQAPPGESAEAVGFVRHQELDPRAGEQDLHGLAGDLREAELKMVSYQPQTFSGGDQARNGA